MGWDGELKLFRDSARATVGFECSASHGTPGFEVIDVPVGFRSEGSMSKGSSRGGLRSVKWAGWQVPELECCMSGGNVVWSSGGAERVTILF